MEKMQTGPATNSLRFLLKIIKHSISALLCIFLINSILSCKEAGTSPAIEKSRSENVIHYDISSPLSSFNPTEPRSVGSTFVYPLLYSFLFVPDENGKLQPDIARSWAYDALSHTWTINLRNDVRFHNNQPVTPKDITHTFDLWLKNFRPALTSLIDRIYISSNTTLGIRLTKNDPYFLKKIWDMAIIPYSRGNPIDFYNNPIGSGPFKFKSRQGENELILEANENYFHGRPSIDGVIFHFEPDKEKTWTRLISGKTDVAQEISPKNYEIIQKYEDRFYFNLNTIEQYSILLYNTHLPLFSDPKVRRALSYAIDRDYIVKKILKNFGRVAIGPMGVKSPYHNQELKPIPYNPQKGLRLLFEAGWTYDPTGHYLIKQDKLFQFEILLFEGCQLEKKVAQYIKLCFNDIGIRVRLKTLPSGEVAKRYFRNSTFQAVLTEFGSSSRVPERLKDLWTSDNLQQAMAGCFSHPKVTHLFHQAINETNPLKQEKCFHEIDKLIATLQPGTFLFHKTAIDAISKRFKLKSPLPLTHEGIYRLRYASLNKTSF